MGKASSKGPGMIACHFRLKKSFVQLPFKPGFAAKTLPRDCCNRRVAPILQGSTVMSPGLQALK